MKGRDGVTNKAELRTIKKKRGMDRSYSFKRIVIMMKELMSES